MPPSLFSFSQDGFDNLGSFVHPYKYDDFLFYFFKKCREILIGIALNLYNALGYRVILTMLILPIQEHGISFHFFVTDRILV